MARRRLIWTLQAANELEAIHDWIAQDDPVQAKRQARLLYKAVSTIPQFPEVGRMIPEYCLPAYREKVHGAYRILYWLTTKEITILSIHASAFPLPEGIQDLLRQKSDYPQDR